MEVFVFPIGNVVFYPSTSKPLNIFEPRYIQMVRDSIRTGTPIALAYVDEPDQQYIYNPGAELTFVRQVAGYGFPLILEEREDGSMVIFLQGQGKVKLGAVKRDSKPYICCEAEAIPENHLVKNELAARFMTLNKVLNRWIQDHVPDPESQKQFLRNIQSPEEVIGCFASYLVADHDMQQLILESNDINEKIDLVNGLISSGEIV